MNNHPLIEPQSVDQINSAYKKLLDEIQKVIIGQDETVKHVLLAIFSQGHCLLVGVPGLAKTLLVQTIASALDLKFSRIQFTPDLMPSDILGSEILDENRKFKFVKGPVFANIILADEINRTPPKTQAALLEAMQEHAVTVAGQRYALNEPFFVLATQNPIEQEGTYPLPEAQLDRFMFDIMVNYPDYKSEMKVVSETTSGRQVTLTPQLKGEEILFFQQVVRSIPVVDNVLEYAVNLVHKTRPGNSLATDFTNQYITWGAGPRASQYLILGAKTHAAFSGKYSPDIEDVKAVARPILRHRLIRNFKAEAEGVSVDEIISRLLGE